MKKNDFVWVFTAEQAWDGEVAETIVEVFNTEEDAIKYLHNFVKEDGIDSIIEYVKRNGWEVEFDTDTLYRAFKNGYYGTDHIECSITKCAVK